MNSEYLNRDNFLKIKNICFEWDKRKNKLNIQKHGISFETAAHIFFDKNIVEIFDEDHSDYNEDRYIAIGRVEDVLYVVYTNKDNNIRLISARKANSQETKLYLEYYKRKML